MDVQLVVGDITQVTCDVIVNAANSKLLGGGGVDGAIHRRGGPEILRACQELRATTLPDGLRAGDAVATTAGKLPARWVIHTVGPVFAKREDRTPVLRSCYRRCLEVADELGARSVAFPLISAGLYRWPIEAAAQVAVDTVRQTPTRVETVMLVAYQEAAAAALREALAA